MYQKIIKPFFPPASRNIILIVLVIGIGAIFYGVKYDAMISVLGWVILIISLFILSGRYGVQVDFERNRYRAYLSFLYLLKFGGWKSLPEVREITLVPEKHFVSRHSVKDNIYNEIFQVRLIAGDPPVAITIARGLYGDLLLEAEELSKTRDIPLKSF